MVKYNYSPATHISIINMFSRFHSKHKETYIQGPKNKYETLNTLT